MPDPIFERYKEALRAGHVAALRGRLDDALINYRRAAAIADERALPHASMAGVLLRLGRVDEAAAAYGRAVERAPDDEAALSGRAEALIAEGKAADAAQTLDHLAEVLESAGKPGDALAALHRAFDLVQTGKRRSRVKGLQQAVRAQLEAAAAVPPLLPESGEEIEEPIHEPVAAEPSLPAAEEPAAIEPAAAGEPVETAHPAGARRRDERERAAQAGPVVEAADAAGGGTAGVTPAPVGKEAIAWPESDRRPGPGHVVPEQHGPNKPAAASPLEALQPESAHPDEAWPGWPATERLPGPEPAPSPILAEPDAPGGAGVPDAVAAPGATVQAGEPPRSIPEPPPSEAPGPAAPPEPAPDDGPPARPRRDVIEWPAADLAQRHAARRVAAPGAAVAAASARGSDPREAGAGQGRDGESGRGASSIGRGGRSTEDLIGVESVPALGSEPEQRFQAAEHAEATGARETAVWMYVQAADGFAARDGSEAALDACHRALAVSPRSAEAHLALVKLYVARGWRERAAEKLLMLDRLLELDHAAADRERVAAMAAEMFPGDLRFPRSPPAS